MNRISLDDQVAVVTGGAQGLGLAIAKRLIASGARVSLWDRDADELKKALALLGPAASAKTADITDLDGLTHAHREVEAETGRSRSSSTRPVSLAATPRSMPMTPMNGAASSRSTSTARST
jgi:NAD(P)-dependent dehydrogenase (short-subunit alcohol dehydrogenase family)